MSSSAIGLSAAKPRTLPWKWTLWTMLGVVLLLPVAVAVRAGLYDSVVDNALSGWGMWGTFAIYCATRPVRRELAATVGLGALMRLGYDLALGEKGYQGSWFIGMGVFLGLAGLLVLAGRCLGPASEERAVRRQALGTILALSYIGVCLGFYISFAKLALPRKLDYLLYTFDGSLGGQASFAMGKLVPTVQPLYWTLVMVYNSLGFWFSGIYAAHLLFKAQYRISVLKLFIANALIGFSMYFLFPAMGPKYAFTMFPQLPGTVHPVSALLSGVPNAMPSLHFAGTLLIFWLARPWRWLYRITGAFAVLTLIATLGLGEHYLIDLVVAVPYALAIFALSARTPGRVVPLIAGAGMVLLWMGFLRTGNFYPAVSWGMVLATIGTCVVLQRSLAAKVWHAEQV